MSSTSESEVGDTKSNANAAPSDTPVLGKPAQRIWRDAPKKLMTEEEKAAAGFVTEDLYRIKKEKRDAERIKKSRDLVAELGLTNKRKSTGPANRPR